MGIWEFRKTRKIYVVEVSKGTAEEEEGMVEEAGTSMETPMEETEEQKSYGSDLGEGSEEEPATGMFEYKDVNRDIAESSSPSFQEYTVQKDDTLQKISKKFYDSYSKWPKIYEANRDVISDPDRIKPGIVLKIPTL